MTTMTNAQLIKAVDAKFGLDANGFAFYTNGRISSRMVKTHAAMVRTAHALRSTYNDVRVVSVELTCPTMVMSVRESS